MEAVKPKIFPAVRGQLSMQVGQVAFGSLGVVPRQEDAGACFWESKHTIAGM